MLLGSRSSSPSNSHPFVRPLEETTEDRQCLVLHVKKLATYIGFSMGRLQAYHVGVIFPDLIERMMHNILYLGAYKSC